MKYKVGDKVRIKNLDWYNENKNSDDNQSIVFANGWYFTKSMSNFCGKELIIERISHVINPPHYMMRDNTFAWTDEMIEGFVEEETSIDLTVKGEEVKERIEIAIPKGYEYVIESGKIIFTKKKPKYPKTYEACENILGLEDSIIEGCLGYEYKLLNAFQKLLMCRDAYWKIAGDEIGLGKPWEPDWTNLNQLKYCIWVDFGEFATMTNVRGQHILAFPTAEIRDAFYENFKELIEGCKELL